ncbi:hypothetical protein HCH15_07975 [Corynebacterium testudinoris]|uniref:Uncharacterized protein n=1 Tax=Corynebacterium testudinoris TaxID=136857 RepID=A0A0G3H8T4_9CORY|nr:hypothetical protein [Corynebacterium testudinoris]AKK07597.1 hypothetical protein CTEST_00635 [Corynebacterium testudinoris]MBX8996117.1 hypothetical protein [Corynebacterium testudinoris]
MTIKVDCHQVRAPEELAGDVNATLDFISRELFLAQVYGELGVEIIASPDVLPTLARAAGAYDGAELPAGFRLLEG